MRINIAIIDDEQICLDKIEEKVIKYMGDCTVAIDKYIDAERFLECEKEYQIIFLDIMLNTTKDGLDIARQYKYIDGKTIIILVSSLRECLADGYKVDAFRFIVKDTDKEDEDFEEAIRRAKQILTYREQKIEFDLLHGTKVFILAYAVKYIKTEKRNVEVHTINDKFVAKGTISQLLPKLESLNFVCSHTSYLVNVEWIEAISGENVVLKNGEKVALSRKRKKEVLRKLVLFKAKCEVH